MDFANTKVAYGHLSQVDLWRAYLLFQSLQVESLTTVGTTLVKGFLKAHLPVTWAIKPTVFKHFVGGETIHDCEAIMEKQFKYGVGTILDYAVEAQKSEDHFDDATEQFKHGIAAVKKAGKRSPFAVFKPSALGNIHLIEKVVAKEVLSSEESIALKRFHKRFEEICAYAHEMQTRILIDAEESWVQSYYDEMVLSCQRRFNKERAIVFNTLQLYRHDKLEQLHRDVEKAKSEGFYYGVKLVRGAYMEKERERAKRLGYPSPIHKSKEDVDRDYNAAIEFCLKHIERTEFLVASHNSVSNLLAVQKMKEAGLENGDSRVYFSQLYGMADYISYNLADAGYNVAKYMPYGPVSEVLPYLFRRAEENSSVQSQAPYECKLLWQEIKRRRG